MLILNWLEKTVDQLYALLPRQKPAITDIKKARIIAHRGAHNGRKLIENTMPAFQKAHELGCWGIELDIHETKDQAIVVNHDPTLNRIWNRDIQINQATLADLKAAAGDIPTLEEVVSAFAGQMHLFIEIKEPLSNDSKLFELLKHLKPIKDYHLISLDHQILKDLHSFPKDALLLVADFNRTAKYIRESIENSYGGVLGHYLLLNRRQLQQLKQNKQISGVGFIDSENNLYRTINQNIDYIFTNHAAKLQKIIQKARE
tara:strand:+ start:55 stop:831 length:777 start_codon:yes stop_codon:yes gene_type:complete